MYFLNDDGECELATYSDECEELDSTFELNDDGQPECGVCKNPNKNYYDED